MDDPQELEHRRHWQELAAQLGLDPGAEPEAVSPAPARAEAARKPVMEAPVPEVTNEPTPADIAPWSPPGMEAPREEPKETPRDRQGRNDSAEPVPVATEAQPEAVAREAEDRPRRGRRRGRRPSQEEGPAAETQGEQPGGEDQPVAEEIDRSSEASRRRGRGRGRHKKLERDDDNTETALVDEEPEQQAPPTDEEADEEEVDNLSNWNVPS